MASSYEKSMKNKPYLPFNMGGSLTKALIAKAQEELGETEDVKAKTIPELRQLVQAERSLFCTTDDAYLLQYLRARKFNVQKAFSLLKNFYSVKKSHAHMYGSFDREALKRAFDQKSGFVLPYRDQDGCAITVMRMRTWDVEVMNASEFITILTLAFLWCAQEPATQICGVRLLVDVRGSNLMQVTGLVRHVLLMAKAFTNCLPIRFKGIHLYNVSPIFRHMVSALKLFLTEKMKNRIIQHGFSQKHLYEFIPKAILPAEDFGGDNPNDVAEWSNAEVENFFEIYRQLTTYGYRQ